MNYGLICELTGEVVPVQLLAWVARRGVPDGGAVVEAEGVRFGVDKDELVAQPQPVVVADVGDHH